tara:strand:- start:4629 stop:6389 length:1761 start_codon:yes stop_codon:yes gene_type:complete
MAATGKPLVLTLKSDGNYTLAEALDIDVSAISTDVLTKFNNTVIDMQSSAHSIGLSATVLEATNMIVSAGVDIATLFGGTDTTLSQEQVEDYAAYMVTGGTQTGIAVTYSDNTTNPGYANFVVADLTVTSNAGSTALTPGDTLTIAGGTNVTTTCVGDTVTINATDTNTTYSIQDGELSQNNFTNADHTKLNGIEAAATADQSEAEIVAAVEAGSDSNTFTDADHSKLDAIEPGADVTDATNVTNAGAVMKSLSTTAGMDFVLDQDDFSSDSATKLATQQSIKSYVDGQITLQVTHGDNESLDFGTGLDSGISFDGTDTNWHLQKVGTGDLNVSGGINMKTGGDLNVTGSLDVYDTQNDIALFHSNTATATIGVVSTTTSAILTASGVNTVLENTADGNIIFRTSDDRVMTMEPGGKVGINTLDPGQYLDVVDDTAGGGVGIRVEHKDNSNAGSDARFIAKVAGSSGGDPHVRFMIQGGQSWCMGLANAASDNFRIADANNLDSGVAMEINTSQNVWMPQSLAVGQSAVAENTAILECESTTKSFLPPRMTTTQRNAIGSPATGSLIYNLTTNVLNFYNGSGWGAV